MKTLSILTPNYNHAKYLHQSIDSVLSQSRQPDEYLICDDASTDDSAKIIEVYASHSALIRVMANKSNVGNIATMERLFSETKCDYILALAADDMLLPGFIEKAMSMAEYYPDAGIIFGKMAVIDENDVLMECVGVSAWEECEYITPKRFLSEYLDIEEPNHSLCGSTIWKRSALEEVGFFTKGLGSWNDTFTARAIALKHGACYIPEPVMCWRYLSSSMSNSAVKTASCLEVVDKAVELMRSAEYRNRFPEEHIVSWSQRYKDFFVDLYSKQKMKELAHYKEAVNTYIINRMKL